MRGAHIICSVDVCSYREEPLDAIDVAVCRCSQQLPTVGVQQLRPFGHRAGVRRVAARSTGQALAAPRSDGVRGLLPTQLLPPHGVSNLHSTKYVFAHALSLVPILTQIFLKEIDFYMIIQPRE